MILHMSVDFLFPSTKLRFFGFSKFACRHVKPEKTDKPAKGPRRSKAAKAEPPDEPENEGEDQEESPPVPAPEKRRGS